MNSEQELTKADGAELLKSYLIPPNRIRKDFEIDWSIINITEDL